MDIPAAVASVVLNAQIERFLLIFITCIFKSMYSHWFEDKGSK